MSIKEIIYKKFQVSDNFFVCPICSQECLLSKDHDCDQYRIFVGKFIFAIDYMVNNDKMIYTTTFRSIDLDNYINIDWSLDSKPLIESIVEKLKIINLFE